MLGGMQKGGYRSGPTYRVIGPGRQPGPLYSDYAILGLWVSRQNC